MCGRSKEKMDSEEKEKILDALKDGQSWLDSNPEADAEEIKEKHKVPWPREEINHASFRLYIHVCVIMIIVTFYNVWLF